jgi:acetolactate synthase-1/2/3 large subunit
VQVKSAIAEILAREGVELIVGYPVNPILEACAEIDIRTVIVRQERTGLHMADAMSRLSSGERPGVFAMQFGPGSENAFGGVAQAYGESVPVLVLPAGYPRRLMHRFPNFNSSLAFRPITKWCEPLTMGKATSEVMRRAFAQLRGGRPGPVLVEVPWDVFDEEAEEPLRYEPPCATHSAPDPQAVEEAARLLREAERPVIYAGQGIHYARAWAELRELAERLAIPVCTSLEGKSAFPEDHPLALGAGGRAVPRPVRAFLDDADVVLAVGSSLALTAYGLVFTRSSATLIHATLDPGDVNKDTAVHHALVGDARLTLAALLDALDGAPGRAAEERRESVPERIRRLYDAWLAEWRPKLTSSEVPLSPYRVLWDLMHTVDVAETIITHDAGSPRDQLSPFWRATTPLSYLGWGKTTQLGYGLGLAMGAKLARPEKLCINVWGDAAIGFTGMDFETAVRERIPILSILLNNSSMAIELPVMPVATEKYRATDISGNYAEMARAFGGHGERVTDPGEIVPAIRRGIAATENGTPALVELITAKEIEISQG